MATKKLRKQRMNADGAFDTLHYETESDVVLRPDGTTVESALEDAVTTDGGGSIQMGSGIGPGPYTITFTEEETYDVPATLISYDPNASGLAADNVQDAIDGVAEAAADLVSSHTSNTNNPHNVTAEQVGARPATWMPSAAEVGADAEGSAAAVQGNLNTHTSNTSNPHSVTKAQVGLGSVPNVATNDQTPTYTEASSLTALASGEKLSVAFGKIKKAVADLISHLSNKSNPHVVTAAQTGASSLKTQGTLIPDGSDFDTYMTPGDYYVPNAASMATMSNVPFTSAGCRLIVMQGYGGSGHLTQICIKSGPVFHYRDRLGGAWSGWLSRVNKSGDTMTGNLTIEKNSVPQIALSESGTGGRCTFYNTGHSTVLSAKDGAESGAYYRAVQINDPTAKSSNDEAVRLVVRDADGTKTYDMLHTGNKSLITLDDIGAAAASHGTHVTFSTTVPAAPGTAAVGSATTVSRSDHVHPVQTTITGNAGSATKLATARNIQVNLASTSAASFNGTANVTPGVKGTLPVANGGTGITNLTGTDYTTSRVRGIQASTTDLTAGSSALANGHIYFVYE